MVTFPHAVQGSARSFCLAFYLAIIISLNFVTLSCTKHKPSHAKITIESIDYITHSSAVVYVNAEVDPVVSLVGLHYSTSSNFSVYDSTSGYHMCNEALGLSGLNMQTKYFVRAWITAQDPANGNIIIRYSPVRELTTKATSTYTDARDGQTYKTVFIGNHEWLAENLNYKTSTGYLEGWDYKNNSNRLGLFYSREVLNQAIPDGWRLPTIDEVNALIARETIPNQGVISLLSPPECFYPSIIYGNKLGLSIIIPLYIPHESLSLTDSYGTIPIFLYNSNEKRTEVHLLSKYGEFKYSSYSYAYIRCVRNRHD